MFHTLLRALIALALVMGGLVLLALRLDHAVWEFLLPVFLIVLGIIAFAGIVAGPVGGTAKEVLSFYFPQRTDPIAVQRQRSLLSRLSLVFYLLAVFWVLLGAAALKLDPAGGKFVLGANPGLGLTVGSTILFGLASLLMLVRTLSRSRKDDYS